MQTLKTYASSESGATGWDSYPTFNENYHWCFDTMHLDGVLGGERNGELAGACHIEGLL